MKGSEFCPLSGMVMSIFGSVLLEFCSIGAKIEQLSPSRGYHWVSA